MKLFLRLVFVVCLVAAILSPLAAQRVELLIDEGNKVKDPPEVVNLQYKFEPGELRRYDITVTGNGLVKLPGQDEQAKLLSYTTLTFIQHAKSFVESDGVWKMEWDMISGTMNLAEFGDIYLTIPPVDLEMDKYGAVRSIKGLEGFPVSPGLPQSKVMGDILGQMKSVGFPHKGLKLGDEWEDSYTVKMPDQEPVMVKTVSKLVEYEHIQKWDCAKIQTTYDIAFTLKVTLGQEPVAASEKPAPGGDDTASPAATEQKPITLKGQEKGELWTYFAYREGKLIQTYGSMELSADVEGTPPAVAAKTETKQQEPQAATPKDDQSSGAPPAPDLLIDKPKHDLYVKYEMVSKFNPDIPKSMQEVGE